MSFWSASGQATTTQIYDRKKFCRTWRRWLLDHSWLRTCNVYGAVVVERQLRVCTTVNSPPYMFARLEARECLSAGQACYSSGTVKNIRNRSYCRVAFQTGFRYECAACGMDFAKVLLLRGKGHNYLFCTVPRCAGGLQSSGRRLRSTRLLGAQAAIFTSSTQMFGCCLFS